MERALKSVPRTDQRHPESSPEGEDDGCGAASRAYSLVQERLLLCLGHVPSVPFLKHLVQGIGVSGVARALYVRVHDRSSLVHFSSASVPLTGTSPA